MKVFAGVLAFGGVVAGSVGAETTSEKVYSYKHWEVEIVAFDDGGFACVAEVDAVTESFSIWTYQDNTARLQFYSTAWDFGETGETANLSVQIDRRTPWTLNNADLYKNSVLFDLPDSDDGVRFLVEVARGNVMYLRSETGEHVQSYSLAGSRASMDALIECGEVITGASKNPFN